MCTTHMGRCSAIHFRVITKTLLLTKNLDQNFKWNGIEQKGSLLRGRPPLSKLLFRLMLASDKRAVQNAGHENRLCPRLDG